MLLVLGSRKQAMAWHGSIDKRHLGAFAGQGVISYYLMVPDNRAFLFLCTVDDFNLIAAPKDLVETFLACSLSAAWDQYERVFIHPGSSSAFHTFYSGIMEYYRPFRGVEGT